MNSKFPERYKTGLNHLNYNFYLLIYIENVGEFYLTNRKDDGFTSCWWGIVRIADIDPSPCFSVNEEFIDSVGSGSEKQYKKYYQLALNKAYKFINLT